MGYVVSAAIFGIMMPASTTTRTAAGFSVATRPGAGSIRSSQGLDHMIYAAVCLLLSAAYAVVSMVTALWPCIMRMV